MALVTAAPAVGDCTPAAEVTGQSGLRRPKMRHGKFLTAAICGAADRARGHWALAGLLMLNILTHLRWVPPHGYLTSGDVGVVPHRAQLQLATSALALQAGTGLGGQDLNSALGPFNAAYALLAHLGVGFPTSFAVIVLWPYLIVSAVGAYALPRQVVTGQVGVFAGGCVLLFNSYTLVTQSGSILVMMGDALLVLWLAQLLRMSLGGVTRGRLIRFLLTGCVLSVYEFRIFSMAVGLAGLAALYVTIWKRSWRPPYLLAAGVTTALVFNLRWLIPLGRGGALTSNGITTRGLFGDSFYDLARSIALFHPFWTGSTPAIFQVQPIPFYFWIVPLGALGAVLVSRRDPLVVLFAAVALVGVMLCKQSGRPFPGLYRYLYEHVPGFNYFRESSKFYIIIALGYAVLVAVFADWVWRRRDGGDVRRALAVFVVTALAAIPAANARPLVNGSIQNIFRPRQAPLAYDAVDRLIPPGGVFYRTLWTPTVSRWAPYDLAHPTVGLSDLINGVWDGLPPTAGVSAGGTAGLEDALARPGMQDLVSAASVRYVVVPLLDVGASDDVFGDADPGAYVGALGRVPWLRRVNIGTALPAVFENISWAPVVVAQGATSARRSLSQYSVQISGLHASTLLTLALPHDSSWVLSAASLPAGPRCPTTASVSVQRVHAQAPVQADAIPGETLRALSARLHVPEDTVLSLNHRRATDLKKQLSAGAVVLVPAAVALEPTTTCPEHLQQATSVGISSSGRSPDAPSADYRTSWLNAWTVSAAEVTHNWPVSSWQREPDGTVTASLLLTYSPQAEFDIGLVVSGFLFALLLGGFLMWPLALRQPWVSRAALVATGAPVGSPLTARLAGPLVRRLPDPASGRAALMTSARGARTRVTAIDLARQAGLLRAQLLRVRRASVGRGCSVGRGTHVSGARRLLLGNGVRIGDRCHLQAEGGLHLGPGVVLQDAVRLFSVPLPDWSSALNGTALEAGAHVGAAAVVAAGVTVSADAVVAPGAVVLSDIAAGVVVAGNPARAAGQGTSGE